MTRVAKELQNVEVTWLDLENATDEEILGSIKSNTKVKLMLLYRGRFRLTD